jgi:1-deoxy-D-xylulose-5-phosphate reductoisomerase
MSLIMRTNICILGSTGSIGTNAVEVVKSLGDVKVSAISCNENIDLAEKQARDLGVKLVGVVNEDKAKVLAHRLMDTKIQVAGGANALIKVATYPEADSVLAATITSDGIEAVYEAIKCAKVMMLANKESLVCAGEQLIGIAREKGVQILPVDSEHSAIFQCLEGQHADPKKILLTASGGPFRNYSIKELESVGISDALNHPTWKMGAKITVDSATMMNKGFEVMEASWLFGIEVSKIQVLVHPQSIVHSAVEFEDNSVIAQMGPRDMKAAIQYAITYPERRAGIASELDFFELEPLEFIKPDYEKFRCLKLALEAAETGGSMPLILTVSNDVAVEAFLNGKIGFNAIADIAERCLSSHTPVYHQSLADLLSLQKEAKRRAEEVLQTYQSR